MLNWWKTTRSFFPLRPAKGDGHDPIKVASRLGILYLPRQVLEGKEGVGHLLPGNDLLPEHTGMVITRGLREWACLLPLDLGFETVQRLLGWITREARVLSEREVPALARQHANELRAAEAEEIAALRAHPEAARGARPQFAPLGETRRQAAWPAELNAAVEAALAAERAEPPEGIAPAVWRRVLAVRREERAAREVADLARLGPQLAPGEVLVAVDEVLVRQPKRHTFAELRTARVVSERGARYLCGVGEAFGETLAVWLPVAAGREGKLLLVSDGARWLEPLIARLRERVAELVVVLDWYHLVKKCKDRISRLGLGREAGRALWKRLREALWRGEAAKVHAALEEQRGAAKAEGPLEELEQYLRRHEGAIPRYEARYAQRQYIGSGLVEKANDLLVARRQKRKGMHWSVETSEALARLKALRLNHEWDSYWAKRQLPRLVAG
jgi:hypothetical protein